MDFDFIQLCGHSSWFEKLVSSGSYTVFKAISMPNAAESENPLPWGRNFENFKMFYTLWYAWKMIRNHSKSVGEHFGMI